MAYNTANLAQKDPPSEDLRVRIVIEFTGNAGEPTLRREYYVTAAATAQTIRRWCIEQAKSLGDVKTVADALTVGQSISLAALKSDIEATYLTAYL